MNQNKDMQYHLSTRQIETVVEKAAHFLFDYCRRHEKHYMVTGVSGGLDSAVVLALAGRACEMADKEGFRLYSIGLLLPCHSDPVHAELGRLAIDRFSAKELLIELDEVFTFIEESVTNKTDDRIRAILSETGAEKELSGFSWSRRVAQGNIKARLRMLCGTYHVARMVDGLVLSTDNYSELLMGFWTINGDVGDLGAIQYILKGLELYDIARFLEVPEAILNAAPTDGLGISEGGDEAQLGADYETVDKIMVTLLQKGFDPDGPLAQLDNPAPVAGVEADLIFSLAQRTLKAAHKRAGCRGISRKELGLPPLSKIKV
ncbi:MAG: NAD(+) synthase [Pseudomonadota bacterium]|nr:NAD(+) synthase [Pseudomonadota bacterium]